MPVPETLKNKIELFNSNGRIYRNNNELFTEVSWLQVMFGQGIKPQGYHPLVDAKSDDLVEKMVANVKHVMHGVADLMPSHEQFIADNCKAPAMPMM